MSDEKTVDSAETVSTTTVPPVVLPPAWVEYITPFANAIGKDVAYVTRALKDLIGDPEGDAAEVIALLKDKTYTPDADISAAVGGGVPRAKLAKAIAGLREVKVSATSETSTAPQVGMTAATFDVLPSVPSDDAWLSALKVGGVLKPNKENVVGAVSAALASLVGLYDLPGKISEAMEGHSTSLEEPVGEDYYRMQTLLTRRNYAEIFAAIPGLDGRFATQARKAALLGRLNTRLWDSLISFQAQLKQWVDAWQQGMSNPAAMMTVFTAMAGGGGVTPPGMMAPPPTDALRDAADGVINDINYVFAGTGIPVALALAYDAQQIRAVLENPALPAQIGASNREHMLKLLNASVSADYPRLERNLKQYALSIIELQNISSGQAELQYIVALFQLGSMIPWDKLRSNSDSVERSAGIGRGLSATGKRPL